MASLDKLIKAFDALKLPLGTVEDAQSRKKDKMQHCVVVAEALCAPGIRNTTEFTKMLSIAFETLLTTAGDDDTDVRMAADESLNAITRCLMESSVGKIQVELHKEMKKNGNPKSLRAALWRFGAVSHLIRPQKGRVYMQNLVPCLEQIARRPEELVLETLAQATEQIFAAIGSFATDTEIKVLLKTLLANLSSGSAVARRTASSCIMSVCLHCKKPPTFLTWSLNLVLGLVLPLREDAESAQVLGALGFFRLVVPHLKGEAVEGGSSTEPPLVAPEMFLQIYELCLHFSVHADHNVANAAMECLQQFLRNCPSTVTELLVSQKGFAKSFISNAAVSLKRRTFSQLSVAASFASDEPGSLLDEPAVQFPTPKLQMGSEPPRDLDLSLGSFAEPLFPIQGIESVLESPVHIPIRIPRQDSLPEENSESDVVPTPEPPEPMSPRAVRPCNVGCFVDPDVPLVHCARLLAHHFLLKGVPGAVWEDSEVRVSVKALALGCLSAVFALHPTAVNLTVDKSDADSQKIWDVLLFADHPDPQLQSLTSQICSSLICSVLRVNGNQFWVSGLDISQVMQPFLKGLNGDSSVTCHQTLTSLTTCVKILTDSSESYHVLPILEAAVQHKTNPYWLVKVRLLELISELEFATLAFVSGSNRLQEIFVNEVVFVLIGDEDLRVRSAAATALKKLISKLYMPNDSPDEDALTAAARDISTRILSHSSILYSTKKDTEDTKVDANLSRVVATITNLILTSSTKHSYFGCCEVLAELASAYPPRKHLRAWGCFYLSRREKKATLKKTLSQSELKVSENCCPAVLLLSSVTALLTTSKMTIDLGCQQKLLIFAGNLFEGVLVCCLNKKDLGGSTVPEEDGPKQPWLHLTGEQKVATVAEQLYTHTCSLLAMFALTLDDTPATKNVLPQALNALPSPIKRKKDGDKGDDKEDKKGHRVFAAQFNSSQQCLCIMDLIKNAHSNYKLTLDSQASEKFLALLSATLQVLAQILEFATITEVGRVTDELLFYLKCTIAVCPASTVRCVQQLLRSLFGSNAFTLSIQEVPVEGTGLYEGCFANHYRQVFASVEAMRSGAVEKNKINKPNIESLKPANRTIKGKDKASLAAYIKLFEPMVIKSLEQYTVTSDVELQCVVLSLLSQLVLLRVNYCLLDSDRIFINFVLKQFELIEGGHTIKAQLLVPQIFRFLVQLSYEKNHSKAIIGVPEILQLCDGLMASGQPPQTHCIPALVPIVEDVFVSRSVQPPADTSELDTQKEVLVAVLLRLVDYHEVLRLLALILSQSKKDAERVRRWSLKILDALFPLLKTNQVRLDSWEALDSLMQLFRAMPKTVADDLDPLLIVLFTDPPTEELFVSNQRWLASYSVVLSQLLVSGAEDDVLARITHLNLDTGRNSGDPLNVAVSTDPPEVIFTRLLFLSVETVMKRVCFLVANCSVDSNLAQFLQQQCAHLLFLIIYLLESGAFCKVATVAIHMAQDLQLRLENINELFLQVAAFCPILAVQWAYLLVLLGYGDHGFWAKLLGHSTKDKLNHFDCANLELVRRAGLVFFSDLVVRSLQECDSMGEEEHLQWLLRNHLPGVLLLSKEVPVQELLHTVQRDAAASGLLLAACPVVPATPAAAASRLATVVLEGVHHDQTWSLLTLLVDQLLPRVAALAVRRQLTSLACRRVEMLLLLGQDEASSRVPQGELDALITALDDRHERLKSLLIKLRVKVFGDSPELSPKFNINCHEATDEKWFFTQVKDRCNKSDPTCCAKLMSQLSTADALLIMEQPSFSVAALEQCFLVGAENSQKLNNGGFEASPLFNAAQKFLVDQLQTFLEAMPSREAGLEDYASKLNKFLIDSERLELVVHLARAVEAFASLRWSQEYPHNVFIFGLVCLEATVTFVNGAPSNLSALLRAAAAVCSLNWPPDLSLGAQVCSACSALHTTTLSILKIEALPSPAGIPENSGHAARFQIAALMVLLNSFHQKPPNLPDFLLEPLQIVIRSIAAQPALFVFASTPPEAWKMGWMPPKDVMFPTLPVEFLLEPDILEQFIYRLNMIGWSSRMHFEESWMAFLGVLNASLEQEMQPEEASAICHAQCLAVRGITSLILQSLALPEPGRLVSGTFIHTSRGVYETDSKLIHVLSNLNKTWPAGDSCNFERLGFGKSYGHSQLSLKFLAETVEHSENASGQVHELYLKREQRIKSLGLDLHSCLHFLLEHYTQLLEPQAETQLVLQVEVVRSVLMLSDVFTERSQFEWMLLKFLEISKGHPSEDEIMHQLLTLGICKATALLNPEESEMMERLKRLLDSSLRSGFLPARLCGLHGLLFLLQSTELAGEFTPTALEYVQKHMDLASGSNSHSERHLLTLWALIFFLLEERRAPDIEQAVLQLALALASAAQTNFSIALVKGVERLVLKDSLDAASKTQVMRLALERLRTVHPDTSAAGLRLLLVCMYTGQSETQTPEDPEVLLLALEKTSALFDKIKKGYPVEAKAICQILPSVLSEFFPPSEMLTKVIGEFISNQQPHPQLLAGVVFQLLADACAREQLPLLQDWLVLCLSNFTQCSPVAMAVWSLTCIFVGASDNIWLRALFPVIQARIGRCESQDLSVFTVAASDFYRKLPDNLKERFVNTFQASTSSGPFQDVIAKLAP